jgi:uncharacterized protein (TIGR02231 family)
MILSSGQARYRFLIVGIIYIAILITAGVSVAAVKEVTLFPDSAQVSESTKIPSQCIGKSFCQIAITLPPQTDPESFVVLAIASKSFKIEDVQIKSISRIDEENVTKLRQTVAKLKDEKKETQAKLQSIEIQIQFWQAQTKAKTKTVTDADNYAAAIGRNVRKAYQTKYASEKDLEKTEKQLKEVQEKLNQAAGKKEDAWEAVLNLSGITQSDLSLSYTYSLAGCGWKPLYRLEANPNTDNIFFSWEAEIWQSTGNEWKQIQLNLATLQPLRATVPPDLPQWIIKPRTPYVAPRKARSEKKAAPAGIMMEANDSASFPEAPAPAPVPQTTYTIWSLGQKNVQAGVKQKFKIKEDTWKAQFIYLARPSISPQAFLQANVTLPQPIEIPPGQAIFVIDGAILGKRVFSMTGSEEKLFFGANPSISVTSKTLSVQSGVKTIFQNKQTRKWQWLIEAKNMGSSSCPLRIEEPIPQVRDERMLLTFKHNPDPQEKDHNLFIWLIDIPGGQKKTIETGIELTAPQDLDIDFGWRR